MNIYIDFAPTDADPRHYDMFAHHVAFRPIFASLVNLYKPGETTGILAEKWSVSSNRLVWKFKLRNNLKFSNGDEITASDVIQSLRRIAYLQYKEGSHSEIFSLVKGYENFRSLNAAFTGLYAEGSTIVFELIRPLDDFLQLISFGLYSIVHPSNYDHTSGQWIGNNIISSGFYEIKKWDNNEIKYALRKDYLPEQRHQKAFSEITLSWNQESLLSSDIIVGYSSLSKELPGFKFYGRSPSSIAYVYCVPWKSPDSPCFQKLSRQFLRDSYYKYLEGKNVKITRSFFPLSLGVSEMTSKESGYEKISISKKNVSYRHVKSNLSYFNDFNNYFPSFLKDNQIESYSISPANKEFDETVDSDFTKRKIDFMIMGTTVLLESPYQDIRFMFKSKDGIRLPDPSGKINRIINEDKFDIQEINEQLWNDGIIWPLGHFSQGLWAKNNIDISSHNNLLPPMDFTWIGQD